jgi:DNA-binding NarL/FixJ family response regulator
VTVPLKTRILLADDHEVVRDGLRMVLDSAPDLEVVAQAGDGLEAVELALKEDVDLAVLDVTMPHMTGREQQVRLTGGLHDVAAAFARCSRACRQGGSTVTPVIARGAPGDATGAVDDELSWFASGMPPTERAA